MALKRILLVEGKDDEHVLKHLCGNRGGPQLDEVKSHEGVEQLLEAFPIVLKATGHGAIVGIVIDADENVASRWASLRDRLVKLGYEGVASSSSAASVPSTRPLQERTARGARPPTCSR